MPYITDHKQKFDDLKIYLDNQDKLRRQANGGNSILFSYQPDEEILYIDKAREVYQDDAVFIDVSKLFVSFIEMDGWEDFKSYYLDHKKSPHKIFRSTEKPEDEIDLFDMIIDEITSACSKDKIPFLIRTGCLYGTGIENVNIMEHKTIMNLPYPLVIFYPSQIDGEKLMFLNFKLASKYRCILVK